jgi:hypothetical protein
MEVTGKVKLIGQTIDVTDSFKKREIVVTTEEQYPQHILIEFAQDKCSILDNYAVGNSVKVSINLRGREWTNPQGEVKYFNQIQGWKIEKLSDGVANIDVHEPEIMAPANIGTEHEDPDLPF